MGGLDCLGSFYAGVLAADPVQNPAAGCLSRLADLLAGEPLLAHRRDGAGVCCLLSGAGLLWACPGDCGAVCAETGLAAYSVGSSDFCRR